MPVESRSRLRVLRMRVPTLLLLLFAVAVPASSQVPPSAAERGAYQGLFLAAARGDAAEIARLAAAGSAVDVRDSYARTPLHVAAYFEAN